jgi:hypothetical protein
MKTYTKTIEEPCLVIEHDTDAESPRQWDNLGFFFTKERGYKSPDGTVFPLYHIMTNTEESARDTAHHMELMKEEARAQGIKIKYIYPVYRYEHGNVVYKRGTAQGFDCSNCGFYIVTDESTKKECEAIIDRELETYTQWCNGEVYGFTLHNERGEVEDSCWGFYDIEDIREHLPKEYADEDLREYIKH